MSTLNYNKEKLIEQLKEKREKHINEHGLKRDHAKKELLVEIQQEIDSRQKDLVRIRNGEEPQNYYSRSRFTDKADTRVFDVAIARLEACEDTVIKLSDKSDERILDLLA